MKALQHEVLQELRTLTHKQLQLLEQLASLPKSQLNQKPSPESWSALECLEHLCRYGDFYLPEITTRMENSQRPSATYFNPGWLGNKFANMMKPNAKPMQAPKKSNPAGSDLDTSQTLEKMRTQLEAWMEILDSAEKKNLTQVRVSISLTQWIRLRLGDALRVNVYHNQRHLEQALRASA